MIKHNLKKLIDIEYLIGGFGGFSPTGSHGYGYGYYGFLCNISKNSISKNIISEIGCSYGLVLYD